MNMKICIDKKYIIIWIKFGVGKYILEYGNFAICDVKISAFIAICNIIENICAVFTLIIKVIKNINPHAITGPIINPIIKLVNIKYMFNLLNCIILIGNIIICADMVTDIISIIFFDFMIFSKKFFEINFWNKIIPIVPPYENWKLKSNIVYGFFNSIIKADIAIFVNISLFL